MRFALGENDGTADRTLPVSLAPDGLPGYPPERARRPAQANAPSLPSLAKSSQQSQQCLHARTSVAATFASGRIPWAVALMSEIHIRHRETYRCFPGTEAEYRWHAPPPRPVPCPAGIVSSWHCSN